MADEYLAADPARRLEPRQVFADPRSRRRRTLHPAQRALSIAELAGADAIYAYSFIPTNSDVSASDKAAAAAEHWYRHRTTIEHTFRDSKHGAALPHLPSGYVKVNTAWMWGALLAACMTVGKGMIATLRRCLIAVPGRLTHHARHLVLRLPPGHGLLSEVLPRMRALPAPA